MIDEILVSMAMQRITSCAMADHELEDGNIGNPCEQCLGELLAETFTAGGNAAREFYLRILEQQLPQPARDQ